MKRKPSRRAASPTGGVPMESLVRVPEVIDLVVRAWELYRDVITSRDESVSPWTPAQEGDAALTALRQALVFSVAARRFLDGNVVG